MKAWINQIKSYFEKKSTENVDINIINETKNNGKVRELAAHFEGLQSNTSQRSAITTKDFLRSGRKVDKTETSQTSRDKSSDFCTESSTMSNMDKTPSMIMDNDQICKYQSDDTIYASFKKRPHCVNKYRYEEEEVVMRLKVQEEEHHGINRYESMLKTPLSQQVIVNKYKSDRTEAVESSSYDTTDSVPTMIDKWNRQCLSNKEKENIIDIALLNSIRKPKISVTNPERPLKMLQLLEDNKDLKWSDTEKVRMKKLLDKISREEVMFHESQFELISSEASYYRSLNVLVDKFYDSPLLSLENATNETDMKFRIKPHQKEHLFSNILQIHTTSGNFLSELEKLFLASVLMDGICDIVRKYAENQFEVYVTYIQNQKFQTEAYNELKKDEKAAKVIEELESQAECCSLSLDSFLLLPMQRLLRILLLLKAIKKHILTENFLKIKSVDATIVAVDKVINKCSAKKDLMDERQQMLEITYSLTFKPDQTPISISSGKLLHKGEVKYSRKILGTKSYISSIRKTVVDALLILTNEYLLIARISKNKDSSTLVEDWSTINDIVLEEISPQRLNISKTSGEFTIMLHKTNIYTVYTKSSVDYSKWITELTICNGT